VDPLQYSEENDEKWTTKNDATRHKKRQSSGVLATGKVGGRGGGSEEGSGARSMNLSI